MSTQQDINAIRAQRFANTHDPLALMANTQTPFHSHHSLPTYNILNPTTTLSNNLHSTRTTYEDRHMIMVDDNVGNRFRENAVQNVGHLDGQHAVQNLGTQIVRNQNGLSVVQGIANQHRNGNVVAARAEGNANKNNV
ncbi:hypothetical protein Tco_0029259 [Tanacetum coccineum]